MARLQIAIFLIRVVKIVVQPVIMKTLARVYWFEAGCSLEAN